MDAGDKASTSSLSAALIAPCGMNCGLCMRYLRRRNRCLGCNGDEAAKTPSCTSCRIKACTERTGDYCFQCSKYPCRRLRQLDARYRTKYGMSMLFNLGSIRDVGPEAFISLERDRWACPACDGVICVHSARCIYCGRPREQTRPV